MCFLKCHADYSIKDYYSALSKFNGDEDTYVLHKNGVSSLKKYRDRIAVRLYNTDVVTYYPDGRVVLYSGGWHTRATSQWIRAYSRYDVNFTKWTVNDTWRYIDGICFDAEGKCLNGEELFAGVIETVLGIKTKKVESCLTKLSTADTNLLWKRCRARNHREIIARFCNMDFLLTLVGSKGVEDIVADRVRAGA